MRTLLLYGLIAILAVAALYGLALLYLSRTEQIAAPARDEAPWSLPVESLAAGDVAQIRLPVALRGYRFAETDLLLDRLTDEIAVRDEEIARLRAAGSRIEPPRVEPPPSQPADPAS